MESFRAVRGCQMQWIFFMLHVVATFAGFFSCWTTYSSKTFHTILRLHVQHIQIMILRDRYAVLGTIDCPNFSFLSVAIKFFRRRY